MLLFTLIAITIILLIFHLLYSKSDLMAPGNVFLITYLLAFIFAAFNYTKWDFDLNDNTFLLLFLGMFIFTLTSLLLRPKNSGRYIEVQRDYIYVSKNKILLVSAAELIMIALTYYAVYSVASRDVSIYNISAVLFNYRIYTIYNPSYNLPNYIFYTSKIPEVACYVLIYCYFNNASIDRRNLRRNINYLLPTIFEMVRVSLSGVRLGVANIILGFIVCGYIFLYRRQSSTTNLKILIKYILLAIGGLVVFYYMAIWLGRAVDFDLVEYISIYTGAPIKLLDLFINGNPTKPEIFGQETFYFINHTLGDKGIIYIPSNYTVHMETRYINGYYLGNVYSAYRRWYNDFGFGGALLLQFGFSLFYNVLYKKIVESQAKRPVLVCFYMYYAFPLFLNYFDDKLYRNIFSSASIIYLFLMWFLYNYFFSNNPKIHIKFGHRGMES